MNERRPLALALLVSFVALASACSGGGGGGGGGGDEGVLVVTVTTPAGMEELSITVSGPDGFSETLTGSATLEELEEGEYTVTLGDATPAVIGTIVDTIHESTVIGSPATVVDDEEAPATVTITFAPRNGSGMLYVPDYHLHAFLPSALVAGDPAPTMTLGSAGMSAIYSAGFDDLGNLLGSQDDELFAVWRAADLLAGHEPTAIVSSSANVSFDSPVVDPTSTNDVWLSDYTQNRLVRYAIDDVQASGTLAPATVVTYAGFQLAYPKAFDAAGNLWVGDYDGAFLARFSAAQLAAGGEQTPSVLLTSSGAIPSISVPGALAFDADGNLWLGNEGTQELVVFAAASLGASGAPSTLRRIGDVGDSLANPRGLAFDNEGALWVAGQSIDSLSRYTAAQIAATGSPTPSLVIGPFHADLGRIAFNPPPAGLPLPR